MYIYLSLEDTAARAQINELNLRFFCPSFHNFGKKKVWGRWTKKKKKRDDQPADFTTILFFRDDHARGRHRGHHESCRRDNHGKVFMRVTLSFSKSRGRDHVEWKERLAFCRRGIECEAEESESVVIVVDDDA